MWNPRKKKLISTVVGLAMLIVFGTWEFIVVPSVAKRQEWSGTIIETYKNRKWWRGFRRPLGTRAHRYYDFFWRVDCEDGEVREVEVPYYTWRKSDIGVEVVKNLGERWPEIDSAEAREKERLKEQAMDRLKQGIKNKVLGGDEKK